MPNHLDCNQLTFSLYPEPEKMFMYEQYYRDGEWQPGKIVPFHNIELSPAANILNYGQGIFEGMKAYRSVKGHIVLFRPERNAARFVRSAQKLAMAPVEEERFLQAVKETVLANEAFIPEDPEGRCSLYIRPVMIGTEPLLGVRPSKEYLFYVFTSPVGPYFPGVGVVRLVVLDVHRASPNGTGDAKAAANYPGTMRPKVEAKKQGFDDVLYLDAVHNFYVEEAGAANFFAYMKNGTLVTPQLGSILPGITRESIIQLAKDQLNIPVEERPVSIEEVVENAQECFLCGTGATITAISEIGWKGTVHNVNHNNFQLAHQLFDLLSGIQLQKIEDPYGWVHIVK